MPLVVNGSPGVPQLAKAVGAQRVQLVRQFLLEAVLQAVAGFGPARRVHRESWAQAERRPGWPVQSALVTTRSQGPILGSGRTDEGRRRIEYPVSGEIAEFHSSHAVGEAHGSIRLIMVSGSRSCTFYRSCARSPRSCGMVSQRPSRATKLASAGSRRGTRSSARFRSSFLSRRLASVGSLARTQA